METTMATVFSSLPAKSLFTFPPRSEPAALAAPEANTSSLNAPPPFTIPQDLYRAVLDVKVPITIACIYAVTAKLLNSYNRTNGKKPWAISQTRPFFVFVLLHNIFLAAYSAWTFWGMFRALTLSVVSPSGPNGLAGTVDSLCRMTGSGGFGEGVFYNETLGGWKSHSSSPAVSLEGAPTSTAPGRIWNEGLAFYGWIFYLSKFYEVLDTFIILAKGKLSSTLQTYHHAGAMLAMWAGIRFMAPPIWMFVLVNSGIHAMMYSYYTCTALSIRVPIGVKRTLTTLQITQFLVGASYAMAHSFISYTVPVTITIIESAGSVAATTVAAEAESTTAGFLGNLKNLVFGAASKAFEASSPTQAEHRELPATVSTETVYVTQPCITTSGGTFAIWLNVIYLAPLTYLFVKFFVTSYIRRSSAETKAKGKVRRTSNVVLAEKAGWDAARGLEREVYGESGQEMISEENGAVEPNGSAKRSLRTRR